MRREETPWCVATQAEWGGGRGVREGMEHGENERGETVDGGGGGGGVY
jgi:hypothetical protein